jgi:hypothetical protein
MTLDSPAHKTDRRTSSRLSYHHPPFDGLKGRLKPNQLCKLDHRCIQFATKELGQRVAREMQAIVNKLLAGAEQEHQAGSDFEFVDGGDA